MGGEYCMSSYFGRLKKRPSSLGDARLEISCQAIVSLVKPLLDHLMIENRDSRADHMPIDPEAVHRGVWNRRLTLKLYLQNIPINRWTQE